MSKIHEALSERILVLDGAMFIFWIMIFNFKKGLPNLHRGSPYNKQKH